MAVTSRRSLALFVAALALHAPARADAHVLPIPGPLRNVPIPEPAELFEGDRPIVRDRTAAIALGKALFWDEQVGSDGMACASCHFHAGADARVRNALGPGLLHASTTGKTFEPLVSGAAGRPNHEIALDDFPFLVLANPGDRTSEPVFVTDDVISSSGTFGGDFAGRVDPSDLGSAEVCTGGEDPIFAHGGVRTRRVEPRNTPTVINAVFSYRQFADGRASHHFNGVNELGDRDRKARVFTSENLGRTARRVKMLLPYASLASQAVTPPVDDREMSCSGRRFADLGRKLRTRRPLAGQEVHPSDSVLSAFRDESGFGLYIEYESLLRRAFDRRFIGSGVHTHPAYGTARDGSTYSLVEANFAFVFGIALQLYQATLVSDESPFDLSRRDANGVPFDLSAEALRGLDLFMGKAHCIDCHKGSEFTAASVSEIDPQFAVRGPRHAGHRVEGLALVDRIALANGDIALLDRGFASSGVAPSAYDPGLGGANPAGRPASYAAQYSAMLRGEKPADRTLLKQVSACSFAFPFARDFLSNALKDGAITRDCAGPSVARVPKKRVARSEAAQPDGGRLRAATAGVFKIPTLRNVELTGPYMHNGGMATLAQVLEFYSRGGNLDEIENPALHPFVSQLALSPQERSDLEAFLRTLTDERVRWERAPFDHPSLRIPDGHVEVGGELTVTPLPGRTAPLGTDAYLEIPAVGREGRTPEQGPLLSFEERLAR